MTICDQQIHQLIQIGELFVAVHINISKDRKEVKFKYLIRSYLLNHVNNNLSENLILELIILIIQKSFI